jgi:micrococcal nuclease
MSVPTATKLYNYRVISFRVVDGDTIVATIDMGFSVSRKDTFRLARIDAPQIDKPEGIVSLMSLKAKLEGVDKVVTLWSKSKDKWGRWLAEVYVGDENVNDWLLANGLAKRYEK